MTTFTIDPDNNITAFAHPQEAEAAASGQSFTSQDALETLTESWPMDRFVTIWNSFAGVAGFGAAHRCNTETGRIESGSVAEVGVDNTK